MDTRSFYEKRNIADTEERKRLESTDAVQTWKQWGPYLSERQWGTVREWYNSNTDAWKDFVHDQARSRAYRWGEDGIAGISDLHQYLCFSLALWNERDPILKERLFGLANHEGNHGEDVKEYYYYLDNTPTHSYMKYLYKYPYEYPYSDIVNNARSRHPLEYELKDTGAFNNNRYFDVFVEYAKNTPEDILIKITVVNRGDQYQALHILPTLLFRNTWSWEFYNPEKPYLSLSSCVPNGISTIDISDVRQYDSVSRQFTTVLSGRKLYCQACDEVLFTENETNFQRFGWGNNKSQYVKDGINNYIIYNDQNAVNRANVGTKAAVHFAHSFAPGEEKTFYLRLSDKQISSPFGNTFNQTFTKRKSEADQFYDALCPFSRNGNASDKDMYNVQRQAYAGMLWGKQLYYFVANKWLKGDSIPPSPEHTGNEQMNKWHNMYCKDIISMPDKWEYPWFAAWDLAFHTTTLSIIDPDFAKYQLELLIMEYYQHPNGQLPAYEWDFCNINPPVHAWAALQVFQNEREIYGTADIDFLDRIFSKLNMNFTWWVNRVDSQGNNIFEGGFLGLDNIRIIDRDPSGKPVEQADGTSWMAMFCLNMLKMATTLAELKSAVPGESIGYYNDLARKYMQHFMYISAAVNKIGDDGLWDSENQFFMDCANNYGRIKVFSMVGLTPLFATEFISQKVTDPKSFYELYGFIKWYLKNRNDLTFGNDNINIDAFIDQVMLTTPPERLEGTISLVSKEKLLPVLRRMLSTGEFLSPNGIRSLSKYHLHNDKVWLNNGWEYTVKYEPAESVVMQKMGGNSNWCGPVWMPVNYLCVQSLRKLAVHFGDSFKVEYPSFSNSWCTLDEVADDLSMKLIKIFLKDPSSGKRPVFGDISMFQDDPNWKDYILFYEYFHGGDDADRYSGCGLGASHQTGWTGVVANLIQEIGVRRALRNESALTGSLTGADLVSA
jgi:hypothetical protein